VLRNVSARIEGRTAEIEQWEEKENPPLKLADAWRAYVKAVNRPDTGPSTLEQYGGRCKQFVQWMKKKHPSVTTMRDVSPPIAEEYAQHLNSRRVAAGTFNKHLNSLALIFRVLRDKARMLGPVSTANEGVASEKVSTFSDETPRGPKLGYRVPSGFRE